MNFQAFFKPEILQDTPRLFTAIAEWIAVFIYIFLYKRRFSTPKTYLICGLGFVVISINQLIAGGLSIHWWVPFMILSVVIMYGFMFILLDLSPLDCGLLTSHAFVFAELIASLYRQLYVWLVSDHIDTFYSSFFTMALIYSASTFLFFKFEKDSLPENQTLEITRQELLAAFTTALGAFIMSNLSFVWTNTPFSATSNLLYVRTLVDFGGLLMLLTQQGRRTELMIKHDKDAINQLFHKQYDQYKLSLDNSEMLRKEMHDLKHYLAALRGEEDPVKREEVLADMEQAIAIQESFMNTGNQVLDVILTTKSLACNKAGITLSAMVDGSLLEGIHVKDICSLFGNLLDNAIEASQQIEDKSMRIINLSMHKKNQFIVIECSNYCLLENEIDPLTLPETTKDDKAHHGYGLKSIHQVAEKYHGAMNISTNGNWFEVKVLLGIRS